MSDYKITFYKGGRKAPAPFKNIALIGSVEEIDLFFTSPPAIGRSYAMNCAHRIDPAGLFMCDLDIATAYGFNYAIVENAGEIPYFCYVKNPVYKNNKTLLSLEVDVLNTFFRRDSLDAYVGATSRCRLLAKHRPVTDTAFSRNILSNKKDKSMVMRSIQYSDDISDSSHTRYAIVITTEPLTDKLFAMLISPEKNPVFVNVVDPVYIKDYPDDAGAALLPTTDHGVNTGVYVYAVPFSALDSNLLDVNQRCYNFGEDINPGEYNAASGFSIISQLITNPKVIDIYIVNKLNDDVTVSAGAMPSEGRIGKALNNMPHGTGGGAKLYYEINGTDEVKRYGVCSYIGATKYLEDTVFNTDVEAIINKTYGYNLAGVRTCLKNAGCLQLVLNDSYPIDPRYLRIKEDGKTELLIKRKKVIDGASLKEIYCIYRYKNYPEAYDTKSAHVDEDLARLVLKNDAWQNYAINNKVQLRSGFIVQTALSTAGSLIGNYTGAALGAAGNIASEFINRANLKAIPDEIRNNGSALFQFALNECRPVIKVYTYTDDVEAEIVNDYKLNGENYDVPQTVTLAEAMTRPTAYYFALKCEIIDPITNAPPEYADQLNDILLNGIRVYVLANMDAYSDDLTSWSKDKNFEEV